METAQIKQITYDNRKIYSEVYAVKPGPVQILQIPKLQYISQEMNTAFHMNWVSHPEPIDEQWVVWKVVNQLKRITKNSMGYKFKLMPHEIIWHGIFENTKHSVTYMMQVPDCITLEMYQEARDKVERNLRGQKIPETKLIGENSVLCAQKLHIGHYRDTQLTLKEIEKYVEEQGYKVKGNRKEIYLNSGMCYHPPETWKTILRVELEKFN